MSRVSFWFLVGVAILLGSFMAIQPAINGQLRWRVGGAAQAALISTAVSTLGLAVFLLVTMKPVTISASQLRSEPWWIWTGGLLGAVYVAMSVVLVQRLGSAVAFSIVLFGQMVCALLFDHFGWLGVPQHEISPTRLLGVAMVVAGVVVIRAL
ncbi:MAG: DMT family transporter [Thermomicrobiales bacterium]|nr:DMT family transporter [Thermomicrobiales bacterium]